MVNINILNHAQMFAFLLKIEYWIPSIIAYHKDKEGACPYCGHVFAHDPECNLNLAILLYMEAEDCDDAPAKISCRMQAKSVALIALEDMKYIDRKGIINLSKEVVEDITK